MMDNRGKTAITLFFLNNAHYFSQLPRLKVKGQKSNYIRVRVEVLSLWAPAWPLHINSSMSKSVSCEPCGLRFSSELVSGVIKWTGHETYTVSYQMARCIVASSPGPSLPQGRGEGPGSEARCI